MSASERWSWLLRPGPAELGPFTAQHLDAALELVIDAVAGAVACSVTELAGATYRTSAASSQLALELDVVQYRTGDGPCMTAARDRQPQYVPDMSTSRKFAQFASAAAGRYVRSSLSIPIRMTYHAAALNIYAQRPDAFDERDRAVADLMGRAITARMLDSSETRALSMSESTQVSRRRTLIQQALEAVGGAEASPAAAFASLARRSSHEGRSIFDVAGDVVERQLDPQ